jgi:hypothetical protein
MYWSSLANYLAALLVTPLAHELNYCYLLGHCFSSDIVFNFVKAYSRTEERKHFCAALEYVLVVHRNLLEPGRGHFLTILEIFI